MLKRLLIVPTLAAAILANSSAPHTYRLDAGHSNVSAKVSFLGLGSRSAKFPRMNGSVTIVPNQPQRARIDVTIDATALKSNDKSTTRRLKGEKFFDVARHPTVRFSGHSLRMTSATKGTVSGKLTARGVTRNQTLNVTFDKDPFKVARGKPISFTGTTRIDRRKYGMKSYQLVVGNKVDITLKARLMPR